MPNSRATLATGLPSRQICASACLRWVSVNSCGAIPLTSICRVSFTLELDAVAMIIVDSCIALLPLTGTPLNGEVHAVVITRSSISDALPVLSQQFWVKATPLHLSDGANSQAGPAAGPDRQLLTMLNTGMSDLSIARLGAAPRGQAQAVRAWCGVPRRRPRIAQTPRAPTDATSKPTMPRSTRPSGMICHQEASATEP